MNNKMMLIVDDNEINQGVLTSIFEDEFTIKTAVDGRTALAQLDFFGANISVVLLDLVMPGMDGFEVLDKMRESEKLRSVPVIVVSGLDEREDGLRAIKCGAADFVTKPVDPELIRIKVDAAISKAENARLRAENKYILLQSSEQAKYQTVLESSGTVVVEYDRLNGTFKYDPSISKFIAGNFDERRLWQVLMTDMVADVMDVKAMQELVSNVAKEPGSGNSMTVQLNTPFGKKQWFSMQVFKQPGQTEHSDAMLITFNNVNDEVLSAEKLRFQAERDSLTGLYNRNIFFEKASDMIAAHEPGFYILACFDIDNFKVINDQYGTEKGNEVLKQIADIFRNGFSPVGGLVGRIMADNYAVLYPASLADSELLANMRASASVLDGSIHPISFSIGRYLVNDLSLPVSAMYDRASLAEASIKGRYDEHVAMYDESMRERLIREQELVYEMKPALETGQFEVWFQPQYNHSTKALIGAEALVRWRHPTRGVISPSEFIPVFERNGFVYELDKYVWAQTCLLLRRWTDEGHAPLPVSVNISRNDLFHPDLVDVVTGLVADYGIPIDLLRLEITESAFSQSTEQVVKVVRSLIDRGFTVEIDDFGSGYSSLNTLKDVPAHILKLDMRFLENKGDADRGGNVLESVVRMAKWLGMAVIAEGVETVKQADYLRSIGCTYVQGYLYAKPMPAVEYESLFNLSGNEEKLLALETVKNLDNNAFWNPESMDTLIFNSFVGAACILEYSGGSVELLRVSETFMQTLGSISMTVEDAMKLDWIKHYSKESRGTLMGAMQKSIASGTDVADEYLFLNLPGCPEKTYLRITLRVIATRGDSHLVYCLNENITATKTMEEKERASTQQLQAIMDNINGGVTMSVIRDGSPQIQYANEQFYIMRGYTKEQYEAEVATTGVVVHPDDREMMLHATSTADKPVSIVYRIIRRDGAVLWVLNNITFVSIPGFDEPVQLSVTNDITGLREAERREHEVSERLQAILDALNSGVSGVTLNGSELEYVFANDTYYSMLGYTKEQFDAEVGNGLNLVHPDDRARIDAELAALTENGGSSTLEYRIIKRDGETAYLRVNASIVNLDGIDGPVSLGISNDITDLVKARQQISALSERMQAVLDNVDCGITAAETGNRSPHVSYLFANDRFYKMHGFTKEQYKAEVVSVYDLVHPEDWQYVITAIDEVNKTGKNTVLEYRAICRDGTERWIRAAISARNLAHVPRPVLFAVYSDITDERQSYERELEAARQLRLLNDAAGELHAQIKNDREVLQTMMDDMPGGFARLRVLPDGAVTTEYVNDNYCRIRGMTRQEIMSADQLDALKSVHPDDIELARQVVSEMTATGETRSLKYRLGHSNGSYIPLSVFARVTTGDNGEKYINAYFADLSEQEKKELTIRETVPFILSAILASSTNLAFAKDRDFRYICGSAGLIGITTLKNGIELVGKTDYELFPKEVADRFRHDDVELLETNRPILDYVEPVPAADGSLRYFKLSKYILRDAFDNILGVYGIGRDITDERGAYAQLSLLVDSIPGGIASYIGSPDGVKLTYFNDGFCEMLGFTREEYEELADTGIASLANAEDAPIITEKINAMINEGTPLDSTHRIRTKDGRYKWVNLRCSVSDRHGDIYILNAVLFDITERVEAENALRMSEEQFRIAAAIGGITVARYDIKTSTYYHQSSFLLDKGFDRRIENVPQVFIDSGFFAPECIPDYLAFYDKLRRGESPCSVDVAAKRDDGSWLWLHEDATVMTDVDGNPSQAIIVFSDITEQREKDTVFRKWQQTLRQKPEKSYMLFRCNLSKNSSFDSVEGKLLWVNFGSEVASFDDRAGEYANQCICADDQAGYIAFMNSDTLLAGYYRGVHTKTLEYREALPNGTLRWLRLTVELVEYPNSTDVEAFLLYEDIDAVKRDELHTKELAEIDPLTGVLNRTAFAQAFERIVADPTMTGSLAVLLLDIDAFKNVNDTLGHARGDQVLQDTAAALRGMLRQGDLLGRLGGDEFLICLRDINDDHAIKTKSQQICSQLRMPLTADLHISTSIGISVCPRDGRDFETLYRKADTALYAVKDSGKNNYAIYDEGMEARHCAPDGERGDADA